MALSIETYKKMDVTDKFLTVPTPYVKQLGFDGAFFIGELLTIEKNIYITENRVRKGFWISAEKTFKLENRFKELGVDLENLLNKLVKNGVLDIKSCTSSMSSFVTDYKIDYGALRDIIQQFYQQVSER